MKFAGWLETILQDNNCQWEWSCQELCISETPISCIPFLCHHGKKLIYSLSY